MTTFIDEQRARWGVEPICRILAIAPSSYYAAKTRPASARAVRDAALSSEITRIHAAHFSEGLAIDEHLTMADLKGVLYSCARQLFGGATILGDGAPALILDVSSLL